MLEEDAQPVYSKSEIKSTIIGLKISIFAVLIAVILIYRSRLVTLRALVIVKKHQGTRDGVAYNKCIQLCDFIFCLSRMR